MDNQTPETKPASKKPAIAIAAGLVLIAGGIVAFASGLFKTNPAPEQNPGTTSTGNSSQLESTNPGSSGASQGNTNTTTPVTQNAKYKDGTYTVDQTYRSPGGEEAFKLSLTIKDDIITATSFTPEPVSQFGVKHQNDFNNAYQQLVLGKNIDDVSLTVVNGASLTTKGFMTALATIKSEASAS